MRLQNTLEFHKEDQDKMSAQLTTEEAKAKRELDDKITAEQNMEDETERAADEADRRLKNRDELIKLLLRKSLLTSSNERITGELGEIKKTNVDLGKENATLDKENEDLSKEIELIIQRIQISALLKEIDVEEMRQLAQSNENLNTSFIKIFSQWERIAPA